MCGEDIKFFLRELPLLEQLTICLANLTSDVEVCGASLMLKHLKIVHSKGGKSIKVSAPNLAWLDVDFENVPKHVGASLNYTSQSPDTGQHFASAVSCCISQLKTLDLTRMQLKDIRKNPTSCIDY